MDILKTATDWAKAEVLSSTFFILFGAVFVLAGIGFWQVGKTDVARAYVIPALVAGVLLLILGAGLVFGSHSKLAGFEAAYARDAQAFIATEIDRVDKVMAQYEVAVFRVTPLIVAVCSALIIVLHSPNWRAGLITTIAMMAVVMLIDANANARLEVYKEKLLLANATE